MCCEGLLSGNVDLAPARERKYVYIFPSGSATYGSATEPI